MYHGVARVCTMVLLGYAPHNIEHSVTHTSKRRQKVYQSPVLGNKHTNVTRERGLGVPGLPRCHCIPTFGKEYVFSLTSHTHHRIKEYGPQLQLPSCRHTPQLNLAMTNQIAAIVMDVKYLGNVSILLYPTVL